MLSDLSKVTEVNVTSEDLYPDFQLLVRISFHYITLPLKSIKIIFWGGEGI